MATQYVFNPFSGDLDVTVATPVVVADGGTGVASTTAYAVIAGGTTGTGAFQSVSGVGTAGQTLTSNGAGALPTWQSGGSGLTSPQVLARGCGC